MTFARMSMNQSTDSTRAAAMNRTIKHLALIALCAALAGCGGGNNSSFAGSGSGTGGGTTGAGTATGTVPQLGSGTPFVAGGMTVTPANIGSNSTATVSVSLVNADGSAYSGNATIAFTSVCASAGTANITSPVTASSGVAQTVYTPKGCSGQDTITATTTVGSTVLTAQGNITVIQSAPTTLSFVSATPSTIGLQGSGQPTSSTVVFQLTDSTGNPVANQQVNFALSTTVGGTSILPDNAKTDGSGLVSTVVQAGTVHTSVVVTASLPAGSNVADATSSALTISTGIPTQSNFSISAGTLNLEAYNVDGVTDPITVHLADRFNNPVPDGTAVTFTTDGGQIGGQCLTVAGTCSVTWTSADPRPGDPATGSNVTPLHPGRVAILAYAVGEETFFDNNGNGIFDDGDTFTDIPEIFEDANEDGVYTTGLDPFFYDFDKNGAYTSADHKWEGLLCADSSRCAARSTTGVGKQLIITMSTGGAAATSGNLSVAGGPITLVVTDTNGNPMPSGTTFKVTQPTTCTGSSPQVLPTTQPNSNSATGLIVSISGLVPCAATLVATTPGGVATALSFTVTP